MYENNLDDVTKDNDCKDKRNGKIMKYKQVYG